MAEVERKDNDEREEEASVSQGTRFEFFGGLGVIGSSKMVISHGGARVQLDMGMDIPHEADLMRAPVDPAARPGRRLADLLRIQGAPRLPGVYDPVFLTDDVWDEALAADPGEYAVFISHAHIDHMGLAGFIDPRIPVYTSPESARLLRALHDSGDGVEGHEPGWRPIDGVVRVGEIEVEAIPVDHDVPGASGFLVTTPDGTLGFTGDIRFHGTRPDLSRAFAERLRGIDVLFTEGTTLSWEPLPGGAPTEDDVAASFEDLLRGQDGLVLVALYPRNVDRVRRFIDAASSASRTLVWPGRTAAFLARFGVNGVVAWGEDRPEPASAREAVRSAVADGCDIARVSLAQVRAEPGRFVVMPDPYDLPSLLDLPIRAGECVLVHSNGQPLGEFDAWWQPFSDWLDRLGIVLRRIGTGGHATADALHEMVETIAPRVVFPIHTFSPARLQVSTGVRRAIGEYGVEYVLADQ